ncbi:MAG TPA: hypothetical protein VMI13_13295 [Solirubrobacteraceae bacterium]|nr:hypothetical protein [Solirubrobacteraceae bacterium]
MNDTHIERPLHGTLLSDRAVPGYADRILALEAESPEAVADVLSRQIQGIGGVPERAGAPDEITASFGPLPAGRGSKDALQRLVERLRGRRQLEDLGEHTAEIPWLSMHVPPGGSASVVLRHRQQQQGRLELSLFGSGGGRGRILSFSVEDDFRERDQCLRLIQRVDVHVRTFANGTEGHGAITEVAADVVRVRDKVVAVWAPCPLCGMEAAKANPGLYQIDGEGVDLSDDDVGLDRLVAYERSVQDQLNVSVPIALPGGSAIRAGVNVKRAVTLTCEANYHFPGRSYLTPLRNVDDGVDMPFWAVGPWTSLGR